MNEDQKKLLIFENYEINCFCPGSVIFHFFVGILKNIQAGLEKSNCTHTFQVFNFYLWLWYLIKGVGRVLFLLVDNIVEKVWICLDISSYKINVVKWNLHNSFKGGGYMGVSHFSPREWMFSLKQYNPYVWWRNWSFFANIRISPNIFAT